MTHEEDRLHRIRRERIARVKRVLRWMPRRANVHKYPVLKWSARTARKRSYLWSFRVRSAVPALYAGCILALLPLYGIQLPLALALAFILKANLPLLASLQFITNPLTVLPTYFASYQVGKVVLNLFGIDSPHLTMAEMKAVINAVEAGSWALNLGNLFKVWLVTSLGAVILGTFLATVCSVIYKLAAYEVEVSYRRLKELQQRREAEHRKEQIPEFSNRQEPRHG